MRITKVLQKEIPGIGEKIKEARLTNRLSLTKICREINMSTANWYRIEQERHSVPVETLEKIEDVLGIDLGINFKPPISA